MITYHPKSHPAFARVTVKLDGRVVGQIRGDSFGFHYVPKGGKRGRDFTTIKRLKASLEEA